MTLDVGALGGAVFGGVLLGGPGIQATPYPPSPGGSGGGVTLTGARYGLGSVSMGGGLMQGSVEASQQADMVPRGAGATWTFDNWQTKKLSARLSFETSGAASASLAAAQNVGAQNVGFSFSGSGPSMGVSLNGWLTSVEYTFCKGTYGVCKQVWEAKDGVLVAGVGGGGDKSYLFGLGVASGGGLLQSLTASATAQFGDHWAGAPLALRRRDVEIPSATMRATFAEFGSIPTVGSSGGGTFRSVDGFSISLVNPVLVKVGTRFTKGGLAVLDLEWHGTGLNAG